MKKSLPSFKILGTKITNASSSEILEYILENLQSDSKKMSIVTPNPEIIMYALEHKSFQEILNRAEIALPDGVGVAISSRILKNQPLERITGVDMMEKLCEKAAERGLTVGFLGGRGKVAEKTAECLAKKYPDLIVSFASDEWQSGPVAFHPHSSSSPLTSFGLRVDKGEPPVASPVSKSQMSKARSHKSTYIDILFVAFGFPKQEEWIDQNLDKIPVTVAMGVGGAFDYVSGKVRRAPKFVRKIGMEWAFRLINEPWRIKRQMALPKFALEVFKERFR